jgi:hypothetical protein
MTKAVVVRYETRPDAGDRNQHLIEQVFAELNAEDPRAPQVLLKRGTLVTDHGHLSAPDRNLQVTGSHAMMLAWARHRGPDRVAVSTTRRTWRSPAIFRCP